MTERLTHLKTVMLKKCPTYNADGHIEMVRDLAAKGDAEAREYLALRAAAKLLHRSLAEVDYRHDRLPDEVRDAIPPSDFAAMLDLTKGFTPANGTAAVRYR